MFSTLKSISLTVALAATAAAFTSCGKKADAQEPSKPALMWFDATGNYNRFNQKDSIDIYLKKIADLGFTHAIVDVRPITGYLMYDSELAPRLNEWNGVKGPDFDYLGHFIEQGHKNGLEVHASLNVFCAGHNYVDRGLIYDGHPEWATIVLDPVKGLIPITEQKEKYGAMVNPLNEEYRQYMKDVLTDLIARYPELDGVMLDRVRYDGISADFSDLSRQKFEEYIGEKVENYPDDILSWKVEEGKAPVPVPGKLANKWYEWRTKNITDYMDELRQTVKTAKPDMSFGTYSGAWYPSYYEVGVNFASKDYDPSEEFEWATPDYKNYGYAELIDLYTTGNYYTNVTIADYEKTPELVWNETDSQGHSSPWYCVEGSCQNLRRIMKDNKFIGGILVDQFYDNPGRLTETIVENIKDSDGLMVFDICHIAQKNLWKEVEEGMRQGGLLKENAGK